MIDGRAAVVRGLQDFAGAVVLAGAGEDDGDNEGMRGGPVEGAGEVVVLLQSESVGDVGLIVGEEDGFVGGVDEGDEDRTEGWWRSGHFAVLVWCVGGYDEARELVGAVGLKYRRLVDSAEASLGSGCLNAFSRPASICGEENNRS